MTDNSTRRFSIKRLVFTFFTFTFVMLATCGLSSADSVQPEGEDSIIKEDWYIGPRIGFSVYTGVIGFEAQHHNVAFAAGLPGNVGFKYYFKPDGHSWFMGGHFMHFKTDTSDFHYLNYDGNTTWTETGFGGGHRWRWGTGWDLSLSLNLAYGQKEERSGPAILITTFVGIRPGVTFGYSF